MNIDGLVFNGATILFVANSSYVSQSNKIPQIPQKTNQSNSKLEFITGNLSNSNHKEK